MLISVLIFSCDVKKTDVVEKIQIDENVEYTEEEDSVAANIPPPPPVTAEKDSVQKAYTEKSPFVALGCCEDKSKRTSKCCCEVVLVKYKEMVDSKDVKLGEYKMTDPILGKCRKKLMKAFDLIDNPPKPAGESEEDFEDLL